MRGGGKHPLPRRTRRPRNNQMLVALKFKLLMLWQACVKLNDRRSLSPFEFNGHALPFRPSIYGRGNADTFIWPSLSPPP